MIPHDHPRYHSLVRRERLAKCARSGIVALEGLTAHGRGEAFDYLLGEKTTNSALEAEKIAAYLLLNSGHPVISVNGNTCALAAQAIADLQNATGAYVEVNLFHRTEERIANITTILEKKGVNVLKGETTRYLPLSHDRAICFSEGIPKASVVLVPLEDGDRCQALVAMGKTVITIDLNPLSRTAVYAHLTIVDELTRALPNITGYAKEIKENGTSIEVPTFDNYYFLQNAINNMITRLQSALD